MVDFFLTFSLFDFFWTFQFDFIFSTLTFPVFFTFFFDFFLNHGFWPYHMKVFL